MTQQCALPPELDDKQLLAYLDDQADESTLLHLNACAYCREKAATLEHFQKNLTTRLYRFACPPPIELGEYHLRTLPSAQMLSIAQHVRECPSCSREVAQLEGFLSDLDVRTQTGLPEKARVLIAQLVGAGTGSLAAAAALRGEEKGPLSFAAEGMMIVLDIQPTVQGKVNLFGQVAADDQDAWTGRVVELWTENQRQFSGTLDDMGAFQWEGVMPGWYELRITAGDGSAVIVPSFQVSL